MTHPYATLGYARSLAHWGEALYVEEWQTPVILRSLPQGGVDAAGAYPICVLSEDADLAGGLARLKASGAVSAIAVLDDFHRPPEEAVRSAFGHFVSFKTHYVYDRGKGDIAYDSHHRRALKKAQGQVRVETLDLGRHWRRWQALYDHLIADMKLTGLHAFPTVHHEALSCMEGIAAVGAWVEDELVSAHIWATDGETMHSHLVASNAKGYETRAAYAVNDFSIRHFTQARILNFGGGAGNAASEGDGLARFKRGFSNGTAQSWLCGAVLDEARYRELSGNRQTQFFPAYRAP